VRAVLFAALLFAACGPKASAGGAEEPGEAGGTDTVRTDAQLTDDLLKQVGDALGCPKSDKGEGAFCLAVDGWDKAQAAELPPAPSLLVGLSVSLPENDPADKALEQTVRFAALGVRGGAKPLVRIASMDPSNADEQKLADAALASVHAAFHGAADVPALPKDVRDYFADLPAAGYALQKGARGWTWKSGATSGELRKAGDTWIAVEVPLKGDRGIFLSIFTPKLK
jgi:hypothetical protein